MIALHNLLMAICAAVVLIAMFGSQFFPTEWNLILIAVAAAALGGVAVIAYATRNKVPK